MASAVTLATTRQGGSWNCVEGDSVFTIAVEGGLMALFGLNDCAMGLELAEKLSRQASVSDIFRCIKNVITRALLYVNPLDNRTLGNKITRNYVQIVHNVINDRLVASEAEQSSLQCRMMSAAAESMGKMKRKELADDADTGSEFMEEWCCRQRDEAHERFSSPVMSSDWVIDLAPTSNHSKPGSSTIDRKSKTLPQRSSNLVVPNGVKNGWDPIPDGAEWSG